LKALVCRAFSNPFYRNGKQQMSRTRELAQDAKAWPFEEARKLIERVKGKVPEKGYVLFETGYGPSGLPHIGTFGEVARTTMVRAPRPSETEDGEL
jgi:hypothetical protein